MWEVATRQTPYADKKHIWGIRDAVIAGERPPVPDTPQYYTELMQACWAAVPEERPTFNQIVHILSEHADETES